MIPDFKTYIGESVWSDMHRRSTGSQTRKEDDVNNLDPDDFYEYLLYHFKQKTKDGIIYDEDESFISTLVYVEDDAESSDNYIYCDLEEINDKICVVVPERLDLHEEIFSKLEEKYHLIFIFGEDELLSEENSYNIRPKNDNEKIDFKFYLSVLNYLIDIAHLDSTIKLLIERK